MGKSTISMAIFHCYVSSPEGTHSSIPKFMYTVVKPKKKPTIGGWYLPSIYGNILGGSFLGFAPSGAVKSKGKVVIGIPRFSRKGSQPKPWISDRIRVEITSTLSQLEFLEPGWTWLALGPPGRCIAAWNAPCLFLAWRWGWSHIDCKHMMNTSTWDFYAAKAAKRFELCFSFSIPHLEYPLVNIAIENGHRNSGFSH